MELITSQFGIWLHKRFDVSARRLRAKLTAETGDRLIEQHEGLQRARRNLYWIGGVVFLLLLARPDDGQAEITLFTSLTLPVYPLLGGLLLYLLLALIQFRQELWRETLRYNVASDGENRFGELERATVNLLEHIARMERTLTSWGAAISTAADAGWANATQEVVARIEAARKDTEKFEKAGGLSQINLEEGIAIHDSLRKASHAMQELVARFGCDAFDLRQAKLLETARVAQARANDLAALRTKIAVETDSFFTLSSSLKFRDRFFFVMVDSALPTFFAMIGIVAGLNYIAVGIFGSAQVIPDPWCPVCPIETAASEPPLGK